MSDRPQANQRKAALLLIDVINGFDFEGSEALAAAAVAATPNILALRNWARTVDVPVIYVNDNFGQWRSDFRALVDSLSKGGLPGSKVTRLLAPGLRDYFVLKPRHSGFYCTALELLLQQLSVRTVILAGFATNICVLFTANDAHMRQLEVVVASDCTASNSPELTEQALEQMRIVSTAQIVTAAEVEKALARSVKGG